MSDSEIPDWKRAKTREEYGKALDFAFWIREQAILAEAKGEARRAQALALIYRQITENFLGPKE